MSLCQQSADEVIEEYRIMGDFITPFLKLELMENKIMRGLIRYN